MKTYAIITRFSVWTVLIFSLTVRAAKPDNETITFEKFGKITLYKPKGTPRGLVLFVSGDGGWKDGVVTMAQSLADEGALVAGIDARHFKAALEKNKEKCYYPAGDFEQLSMKLQKQFHFNNYEKPVLVGYSYGATLVYGILGQAPSGTFKGALALGFSPDIDIKKPLCKGNGLEYHVLKPNKSYYLEAETKLPAPFIVLHGVKDQVCSYQSTEDYLKKIPEAELIALPKVGHGFSVAENWLPQFKAAYLKILQTNTKKNHAAALKTDLPLEIIPSKQKGNNKLVFFISGDGGWTSFDQGIADGLAAKGAEVIGLDAQRYFWNAKTPLETTEQITNVLRYYLAENKGKSFTLAGYSFGACIAPFIVNRLPEDLKSKLSGFVMVSPDEYADFEIHITDMISIGESEGGYNVIEEIKKLLSVKSLCVFGKDEDKNTTAEFRKSGTSVNVLPGGHHFNNNFLEISNLILGL